MTSRVPKGDELSLLSAAVARLRARVAAITTGMICGAALAVATLWLVIRGGVDVGAHLGLLRFYFPGYTVTWWGAVVGFWYGAAGGAVVGWSFASLYNLFSARRQSRRL
jgi:hypothetical protein